ncbi:hypothetical protein GUJ93_ZPchr0006g46099 [Zizania palustris]|uniref:Uncharacterized protein n=1 Tax=Zizania palustris TaxID=103762 RepID=A0A8J5SIJ3_ZIZPA|nr:hypothetical protein GUJ93_ZPchr0006g46099 [Zizania palustris]
MVAPVGPRTFAVGPRRNARVGLLFLAGVVLLLPTFLIVGVLNAPVLFWRPLLFPSALLRPFVPPLVLHHVRLPAGRACPLRRCRSAMSSPSLHLPHLLPCLRRPLGSAPFSAPFLLVQAFHLPMLRVLVHVQFSNSMVLSLPYLAGRLPCAPPPLCAPSPCSLPRGRSRRVQFRLRTSSRASSRTSFLTPPGGLPGLLSPWPCASGEFQAHWPCAFSTGPVVPPPLR